MLYSLNSFKCPVNCWSGKWNESFSTHMVTDRVPSFRPSTWHASCTWESMASLLILVPKSAVYWRRKGAGIDSSSGFSPLQHAKLEKSSQVKLSGCVLQGLLKLLVHFQSMWVHTLWVSLWELSLNPQINQDQAKPLGLAYFLSKPKMLTRLFFRVTKTNPLRQIAKYLRFWVKAGSSFRLVQNWMLRLMGFVLVYRGQSVLKKLEEVVQLVKFYTLGVKKLCVPKEISHDEL